MQLKEENERGNRLLILLTDKLIEAVDGEQVNLLLLTRIAKSAPHPLVVIAMGILCERGNRLTLYSSIHLLLFFYLTLFSYYILTSLLFQMNFTSSC